jgi:hypothetical protein
MDSHFTVFKIFALCLILTYQCKLFNSVWIIVHLLRLLLLGSLKKLNLLYFPSSANKCQFKH